MLTIALLVLAQPPSEPLAEPSARLSATDPADIRPNVLFIAVDDLRPEIASFGVGLMKTPNLDRLAARGTRFERAYCNVPVCGASRASLMTGVRPSPSRFRSYDCFAEQEAPEAIPLNTHFSSHGYRCEAVGKVYHNAGDHADGWAVPVKRLRAPRYALKQSSDAAKTNPNPKKRGAVIEHAEVDDSFYVDGRNTAYSVGRIGELASGDQPWFLAVGLYKPHLPFVMPERYWRQYGPADPEQYFIPPNLPRGAIHQSGEIRSYAGVKQKGTLPLPLARDLIRGYRACVSYTDRNVGQLLDALDASGAAENTIVVLWGDHGWNLGEHTLWCKHSCFETSCRTPLMIAAPKHSGGQRVRSLVEFTDIYPTLLELAGLPAPRGTHPDPTRESQLDGQSLVPLLDDPEGKIREWAISRYGNGETIKTHRYRYTEYLDGKGKVTGRMMFDHQTDPEEIVNIADDPNAAEHRQRLASTLHKHRGRDGG